MEVFLVQQDEISFVRVFCDGAFVRFEVIYEDNGVFPGAVFFLPDIKKSASPSSMNMTSWALWSVVFILMGRVERIVPDYEIALIEHSISLPLPVLILLEAKNANF